ncbi:adaptor protein MecA [Lachnoclostridium edouardi]|uniref:adaptor protein MecA n=1 Tax=Lachnoclostridium edouardi TaxID=1926283 RepID=UPI000C7A5925|nr:adaptor protein MecA [Lachnoclostridium edouardi]
MKIERVNENQIRCTLSSFDLSVRNLNLGELAYGTEKARNLFREMIQKASNEVGFEADDIPLMVEAIPLSSESVMLVITKIEDPEELDTRFSKFSPMQEEEDNIISSLAGEYLEGADVFLENFSENKQQGPENHSSADAGASVSPVRIYSFDKLDTIIEAAHAVGQLFNGKNSLYKNPENNQYYLIIYGDDPNSPIFSKVLNLLAEYGSKVKFEYAAEAYYREHYELITKDYALQALSSI